MTESISGMTNNASAYRQLSAYKPLVADKLRWKLTPTLTLNRNYSLLLYKKVRLSQLEKNTANNVKDFKDASDVLNADSGR